METPKPVPESMSVEELDRLCQESIAESEARMETHDEALAIQAEANDDGLTTTERAIRALDRPERFRGEHDVARAWLRNDPTARVFSKVPDK